MATDFLAYWKPSTVDRQVEIGEPLNHAASAQFHRAKVGDTVWIVTVRDGHLRLVGKLDVAYVTGQAGAARLLGKLPNEIWDAEFHVVSKDAVGGLIREVCIQQVAPQLRFASASGCDQLIFGDDDGVNAQQLQTMRVLTSESAEMLSSMMSLE